MYKTFLLLALTFPFTGMAQTTKRVLFIGNSYTGVNNLPQMTANLTDSAGDSLIFDTHNPGGQSFQGHFTDPLVAGKIAQGNWDFVVLQEQSQRPAFPDEQVAEQVFPYAHKLDSMIREHNPCAETLFYMTWGRKNGDASNCAAWPPVCTYQGMDSLLHLRYMQMAEANEAAVSPVGQVWKNIRANYPDLELYTPDESHPSFAGTYAAACTFYTTIFGKSPLLITDNLSLNAADAQLIREAARVIAYDSLSHWFYRAYEPQAAFVYTPLAGNEVQFSNESLYSTSYAWSFGDGQSSPEENPGHVFPQSGNFEVQLIVSDDCGLSDTVIMNIHTETSSLEEEQESGFRVFPNPATTFVFIESDVPDELGLFDLSGRKLSGVWTKNTSQLNLSHLESGVYILQNTSGKRVVLHKL